MLPLTWVFGTRCFIKLLSGIHILSETFVYTFVIMTVPFPFVINTEVIVINYSNESPTSLQELPQISLIY